jgi:hypothetical protein
VEVVEAASGAEEETSDDGQRQVPLLYKEALPKTHSPSTQNVITAFAFTAPDQLLYGVPVFNTASWQSCAAVSNSSNLWSLCRPFSNGSVSKLEYEQ